MKNTLRLFSIFTLLGLLLLAAAPEGSAAQGASARAPDPKTSVILPSFGEKVWINKDFYFIHNFDKRPALGPLVLKIQLYTKDGARSTLLSFKGNSDMPSMRGAHYTGDHPFRVSKKGDYLLPVDVVMPGDWEIQVFVFDGEKQIFAGVILFDV